MKVLLVPTPPDAEGATRSGVEKYLYELARAAPPEVEYVFLDPPQRTDGQMLASGAAPAAMPCRRVLPSVALMLGYVRETRRLARRMRPFRKRVDLIHTVAAGCEVHNIAARLAGFRPVLSTVQTLPGMGPLALHWVRRLVERISFRCADCHIVVSDATYEGWRDRVRLSRDHVVTIFNGMQPPDFTGLDREAYRRQFGVHPGTVVFGICARLHPMKGHRFLIEGFARLRADVGAAQAARLLLLIAGEGVERTVIERLVRELGLGASVRLLGHRSDPCPFIASLDVHALPSVEVETLGYANIEAMFAGVPTVVSDFGGMKEIVRGSGGGRIVPAGDAGALCAALRHYLDHPEAREADGARAKAYAQRHLTSRVMADATLAVYRQLVARAGG